ncbi:penicillin amidase Cysteine peptidase. MEROPS family C59 [Chitinophaga jiangningensis]|uniref:Penicillin amidase Cysteine peptidase. MEROPS family C59 n=1 Tax=Chitinophaga jiangningensis TaxID=1419482 RepID=A0A1M7BWT8_9BACT|nr:linear amide C-N hydrolase [Chitinophaga jiangningensis]SHL59336.1 penicillin amidase Cysteine peptidase. MEROPS family C59 [Chitinophaga jiangningensis]
MIRKLLQTSIFTAIILAALLSFHTPGNACTRVMYKGLDGLILTGRSMDWKNDIETNLWIFPRGMARDGATGANTIKWTSKYGSVVAAAYDICSTDGMNEKGFVANLLWLVESQYPKWDKSKPGLSIAGWVQYMLDNFATVKEAVAEMKKEKFVVVTDKTPGEDRLATLHLSISDATGDNAVLEYLNGKLVIHEDPSYDVMTNSPTFDKQLALNEYWKEIGGTTMLPGTNRAADRFVRASFYIGAIPKTADQRIGVASVFSVVRNCSVPYGISTENQPNISTTRWRCVSDQKNLVYFFETALTPNTFWVNFKDVDFSEKAPVKKLGLTKGETYAGNAVKSFVNTPAFKFLSPSDPNI